MTHSTAVQFPGVPLPGRVWALVPDPVDQGDTAETVTILLSEEDHEFLRAYAKYLNTLAKAQEKKLKRSWSRKSLAEKYIADWCIELRAQMKDMLAAVGPLPSSKDKKAMERYVERVVAWTKSRKQ